MNARLGVAWLLLITKPRKRWLGFIAVTKMNARTMPDRMPEYTPRPDGIIAKPTPVERKALFYHNFHDTPDRNCNACAWESSI